MSAADLYSEARGCAEQRAASDAYRRAHPDSKGFRPRVFGNVVCILGGIDINGSGWCGEDAGQLLAVYLIEDVR